MTLLQTERTTQMTITNKLRRMARPSAASDIDGAIEEAAKGVEVTPPAAPVKRPTKQSLVLGLLHGDGGVALTGIVEATGWLPHTARAALTGLRKKGHAIVRSRIEGVTRYAIMASTAQ